MGGPKKQTVGKHFGAAVLVLSALFSTSAQATCPTFHTLTNGTTADASQVMDNFNSILQCPNFTGNVGIGTATPTLPLEVNGGIRITSGSHHYFQFGAYDLSTDNFAYLSSAGQTTGTGLKFETTNGSGATSGATRMTILNNGNVGIGTDSPAYSLDASSASGSAVLRLKSSASAANLILDRVNASGSYSSQVSFLTNGSSDFALGTAQGSAGYSDFSIYNYGTASNSFTISKSSNDVTITGCLHYNGGTSGTCLSDERVKRDVSPFLLGLAEIARLDPVTYKYNGLADTPNDEKTRTGLLAQQVQRVAPGLVTTVLRRLNSSDTKPTPLLEVDYGALTFALINSVKELKAANDNQLTEIEMLRRRIAGLEAQVALSTQSGVEQAVIHASANGR